VNSYQIEYLGIWKTAFAKFLGWSEEETLLWAETLLVGMNPPGMVINEPPLYYVARELAWRQPCFDDLSQREGFELIRGLQNILAPNHERGFAPGFDFEQARNQIGELARNTKPER